MVDKNELMVNNLVYEFDSIKQWNIYDYTMNPESYSPIAITPKLLENLGFKENGVRNATDRETPIEWELNYHIIIKQYGKFEYVLYSDEWATSLKSVTVNTIHQLQNLHFAVTGEQLIFKTIQL